MFRRHAVVSEIRATTAIALPLAAGNLAQMALGFTDTVMVGHLGGAQLAAAGLGAMLYFTVVVMVQGILSAVAPLAAHAVGAGDRIAVGHITAAGLILAALLSLPVALAMTSLDRVLHLLDYDPALAAAVGSYLRAIAWGAPAFLGFAVLRSFLAAVLRARAVMVGLLFCIPANAALNWVLIFGHLGAPALGVAGSGYASAIAQWLMLAGVVAYVGSAPGLAGYRRLSQPLSQWPPEIGRILRLGLPIGGLQGLEIGVFMTVSVLMGLLGADALGAHQLVLNCASMTFMVPLGIGQAATVRVASRRGAGEPDAARRAGFVALALGSGFMTAAAIVLWTMPRPIIGIYLDVDDKANRAVVAIALRLIAIAALFQVFDGVQTIAAGALRGYQDAAVPMALAGIGYWGIGFAGGWLLAFPLGQGPVGLWCGLALGLGTVAILLTLRLRLKARSAG